PRFRRRENRNRVHVPRRCEFLANTRKLRSSSTNPLVEARRNSRIPNKCVVRIFTRAGDLARQHLPRPFYSLRVDGLVQQQVPVFRVTLDLLELEPHKSILINSRRGLRGSVLEFHASSAKSVSSAAQEGILKAETI